MARAEGIESGSRTGDEDAAMTEPIDIEMDDMLEAWAVAPTEACTFVPLAVFARKSDATAFARLMNMGKAKRGGYGDCAVVPAKAAILCANTYDVKAGREALAKAGRP
jgi:hypothetical protein